MSHRPVVNNSALTEPQQLAGSANAAEVLANAPVPQLNESVSIPRGLASSFLHVDTHAESVLNDIAAFRSLAPEQQSAVITLFNNLEIGRSSADRAEAIENLLSKTTKEGLPIINLEYNGQTLLEHLSRLATSDRLDSRLVRRGITKDEVLTNLIETITDASLAFQDSTKATCPAGGLEYQALKANGLNELARFAASVTDLATTGRFRSELAEIELPPALPVDKRSPVSTLVQSAVMNFMSDQGYDALTDTVYSNSGKHSGAYCRQVEKGFEGYFGRAFSRYDSPAEKAAVLKDSLERGTINAVCISGLSLDMHALHLVNAVKPEDYKSLTSQGCSSSDRYTYFRNPWGNSDLRDGQGGAELVDAKEGIYRLPKEEFLSRTTYVVTEGGRMGETPGATDEVKGQERPAKFITWYVYLPTQSQPILVKVPVNGEAAAMDGQEVANTSSEPLSPQNRNQPQNKFAEAEWYRIIAEQRKGTKKNEA